MSEGVRSILTTTTRSGIVVLVDLDGTFCGSYNGGVGVDLRIDQPCLDVPGDDEINGGLKVLGQMLRDTSQE